MNQSMFTVLCLLLSIAASFAIQSRRSDTLNHRTTSENDLDSPAINEILSLIRKRHPRRRHERRPKHSKRKHPNFIPKRFRKSSEEKQAQVGELQPAEMQMPAGNAIDLRRSHQIQKHDLRATHKSRHKRLKHKAHKHPGKKKRHKKQKFTNLCIDGHIAPELLLFGPARASTSTFAQNFGMSPNVAFGKCLQKHDNPGCTSLGIKEMHFFHDWDLKPGGKKDYLSHYPQCTSKQRIVAADLTPGQHVPGSGVLPKIAEFYGDLRDQVNFVMLIREPAACMQSFYHFEEQEKKRSFESYVQGVLKTPMGNSLRYLNNVLVADSLDMFFFDSPFKASQLTIVPMRYNEADKDGFQRAPKHFWNNFQIKGGNAPEVERANYNDHHVTVEEDLKPATLAKLRELLDLRTGADLIASTIQKVSKTGDAPRLYGFRGDPLDVNAVKKWIEDGW